jgi:hypothetical protein
MTFNTLFPSKHHPLLFQVKKEELEPGEIRLKSGKMKVGAEGDLCVVPYSLPSVRNFPTEAEVASILRSVAPVNLLQEKQRTVDPVSTYFLMGLMHCLVVYCKLGQKPETGSFIKSPDWLRSDQWKPRYLILSQWNIVDF